MRPASALAQLTIWASTANAFYPFDPKWHLELVAEQSKRSLNGATAEGVTLPIKQRIPSRQAPYSERVARDSARLSKKYAHQASSSGNGVVVRDNQYNIMTAVDPNKPMTEGIDQDGTDYSYFVSVQFGSSDTELYMLVDTGAGSTWVMGSSCTSTACTEHNTFNPDDSSSYEADSDTFSVSYGSGSVSGSLGSDNIGIAGITLKYQFGVASQTTDDFVHFAFDGILGLSRGKGANENFLQTLEDTQDLSRNIFAVALNRASDGTDTGEISFGTIDKSKYTGDVTYTATGTSTDWCLQIDDMAYNGKKAGVGGVQSYIDTGTSFVFGPKDLVQKVHAVIPGADSSDGVTYTVPCDSDEALTFTFSGVDYEVSSKDWISPPSSSGQCTSNIYGQEVVEGSWLLGDTFLKNVYAIFDVDKSRIGFATMAAASGASSSSASPSGTSAPSNGTIASATRTSVTGPTTQPLGLSGHETHAATGTAAAETSGSPKHHSAAAGGPAQIASYASVACLMSFLALLR